MPKLTVDVKELEQASFNVQRRESWICAIVYSLNGETVLQVDTKNENSIEVKNNSETVNANEVYITVRNKIPIALCVCENGEKKLIWANLGDGITA